MTEDMHDKLFLIFIIHSFKNVDYLTAKPVEQKQIMEIFGYKYTAGNGNKPLLLSPSPDEL